MKKNNDNLEGWIRKAFERAGEQAKEIEQLASNMSVILDKRSEDIIDAWAEVSDADCIFNLASKATREEKYADTLYNLMKMGLIAGYVSAIDDMKDGRLKGFV